MSKDNNVQASKGKLVIPSGFGALFATRKPSEVKQISPSSLPADAPPMEKIEELLTKADLVGTFLSVLEKGGLGADVLKAVLENMQQGQAVEQLQGMITSVARDTARAAEAGASRGTAKPQTAGKPQMAPAVGGGM